MHMFIAALFTIAETWKQPKCPSTNVVSEDVVHIHDGLLLSHKQEQNNAICSNMHGTRDPRVKRSKLERPYDITYIWNLIYGRK